MVSGGPLHRLPRRGADPEVRAHVRVGSAHVLVVDRAHRGDANVVLEFVQVGVVTAPGSVAGGPDVEGPLPGKANINASPDRRLPRSGYGLRRRGTSLAPTVVDDCRVGHVSRHRVNHVVIVELGPSQCVVRPDVRSGCDTPHADAVVPGSDDPGDLGSVIGQRREDLAVIAVIVVPGLHDVVHQIVMQIVQPVVHHRDIDVLALRGFPGSFDVDVMAWTRAELADVVEAPLAEVEWVTPGRTIACALVQQPLVRRVHAGVNDVPAPETVCTCGQLDAMCSGFEMPPDDTIHGRVVVGDRVELRVIQHVHRRICAVVVKQRNRDRALYDARKSQPEYIEIHIRIFFQRQAVKRLGRSGS